MARGDKRYREERRKKGGRRGGEKFARKIILTGRANKNGAYPGILPAFSPSPSLSLSSCDRSRDRRLFREIFHGEEKIAPRIYSKHDEFVVAIPCCGLFCSTIRKTEDRGEFSRRRESKRAETNRLIRLTTGTGFLMAGVAANGERGPAIGLVMETACREKEIHGGGKEWGG